MNYKRTINTSYTSVHKLLKLCNCIKRRILEASNFCFTQ